MKNILLKINLFFLSFILLFTISCKNNVEFNSSNITDISNTNESYITFSVSNESARTVFPENFEVEKLTGFILTNGNGDCLGEWASYKDLSAAKVKVAVTGVVDTFTLYARCSSLWLKGSVNVIIKSGENNLGFNLNIFNFENDGYGNVSFTLKMPASKTVESSTIGLVNYYNLMECYVGTATDPKVTDDYVSVTFNAKGIPTGFYRLYIQSKLTDGTYASHSDTVYVVSNKTSSGECECITYLTTELPSKLVKITFCDGDEILDKQKILNSEIYFDWSSFTYSMYVNGFTDWRIFQSPKKEGYIFAGWCTDVECSNVLNNKHWEENSTITVTEDISLYAKWNPAVTITFDTNGGRTFDPIAVETGSEIYFECYSAYFYLYIINGSGNGYNNPTKNGYVFAGWYTDAECSDSNKVDSSNKITITEDITLYAKWNPAVTITFDTNGGSLIDSKTVGPGDEIYFYYYSTDFNLYINGSGDYYDNPAKNGYIFAGWYTDAECSDGNKADSSNIITVTEDITLYAKWNLPVTITFNTNGGGLIDSRTVGTGDEIYFYYYSTDFSLCINGLDFSYGYKNPTKNGYVFGGWYTDAECSDSNKVDSSNKITLTEDTTLYAKWNPAVTISFNTNGGRTLKPIAVGTGDEIYFYYYSTYFYLYINGSDDYYANPTKTGYIFAGWYTDAECSDGNKVDSTNKITITEDITLYAKWIPAVTILFDTNGGSLIDSRTVSTGNEIYFDYYSTYFYLYINGSSNYYANPTKSGYIFAGWYTDAECSDGNKVNGSNIITVTEDITLYAKWNLPVTITFNTNGGSLIDSKTIGTGDEIYFYCYSTYFCLYINGSDGYYDNPTKSGYIFAGWYTDAECSDVNKVDWKNQITVTEDITLYAKWKPAVTIAFDTNGGSLIDSETVGTGDEIYFYYYSTYFHLYINGSRDYYDNPTKTGYIFAGWYTDAECSDGNKVDWENPITATEDITVYAKWVE